MLDFSIIIPVWNTPEKYLKTCISSLEGNLCSYEVLLVDDGSEKTTADLLESMQSNVVRVLHMPHGGISKARNYGLRHANGKYVSHADSDDYFAPGILDYILKDFLNSNADLIIGMISRKQSYTEEGSVQKRVVSYISDRMTSLKRDLRVYYTTMKSPIFHQKEKWVNRAPHARFMTRDLALTTPFRENIPYCEDVIWNFDLLNNAGIVVVAPVLAYYYIDVPFSNTQKFRANSPEEIRILMYHYYQEIKTWPVADHAQFEVIAIAYFSMLMRVYVFSGKKESVSLRFWEIYKDPFWQKIFRKVNLMKLSGTSLACGICGKFHFSHLMYWLYSMRYLR